MLFFYIYHIILNLAHTGLLTLIWNIFKSLKQNAGTFYPCWQLNRYSLLRKTSRMEQESKYNTHFDVVIVQHRGVVFQL